MYLFLVRSRLHEGKKEFLNDNLSLTENDLTHEEVGREQEVRKVSEFDLTHDKIGLNKSS